MSMWPVAVMLSFLSSLILLLKIVKGADISLPKPDKNMNFLYDGLILWNTEVVFESRPFDYEVDLPLSSSEVIPSDLSDFNPYFEHLSKPSLLLFEKEYFALFCTLYPGLECVPLLPTDVEDLILFGLLHMMGHDPAFLSNQFVFMSIELSRAFGDRETFCKFVDVADWSLLSKADVLKKLFEWSIWRCSFYTFEAFFQLGLEDFSQENLLLTLKISRELGDLRMVNRISSELDAEVCKNVFASEELNCAWPKMEDYPLVVSNVLTIPTSKQVPPSSFDLIEVLGKGSFGECWKVSSATGKKFALKIFIKTSKKFQKCKADNISMLRTEITIQQSLDHEGIAKLFHVVEDASKVFFLMELCSGSNLSQQLKVKKLFGEAQVKVMMLQIVSALDHIHQKGIIHRDIKPENLVFDEHENVVKIVDFGLSRFISTKEKAMTWCGSESYMAPEILSRKLYGFEADIWSLGVTLFELATGCIPFKNERSTVAGQFSIPPDLSLSGQVKHLIVKTLVVNRERRITIQKFQNDDFFQTESSLQKRNFENSQ